MRNCPVCESAEREFRWSMDYQIPDGWPLPKTIDWYTCLSCGMLYGDGDFTQEMLNDYYLHYYGYGLHTPENIERLKQDARNIALTADKTDVIVDFGGGRDSHLVQELQSLGFENAVSVEPGDEMPACDIIFASHVLEHVYDLPITMNVLMDCLSENGTLIMDGPDSFGLLRWSVPILDYNTKHINHFTLRDYLNLGWKYGLELVEQKAYSNDFVPAGYQLRFRRIDVADQSMSTIHNRTFSIVAKLKLIDFPVNVWGLNDLAWHLLGHVQIPIQDFIDNDPAYRGKTYQGKPVLERPTNDYPILVMVQGQKRQLVENIKALGLPNDIIEV